MEPTTELELDDILPMGEALQLLGLGILEEGDLRQTDLGRQFVEADTDARKTIFATALRANVPLVAQIRRVLDERPNHRATHAHNRISGQAGNQGPWQFRAFSEDRGNFRDRGTVSFADETMAVGLAGAGGGALSGGSGARDSGTKLSAFAQLRDPG